MGVVENISVASFPKQGGNLGRRVTVCFNYDTSKTVGGKIVRDDTEEPFQCIIGLDDGRFVRATECQYMLAPDASRAAGRN